MKFIHASLSIVIISALSLGSLGLAEDIRRTKKQDDAETEALNTANATALVIESYRLVRMAVIEAEFQKRVRASAKFGDTSFTVDSIRSAAKRRDARVQQLELQLDNMRASYYAAAISTTNSLPVRLDRAAAATRLREIAASSNAPDLDPQRKMLVKAILHPTASKTEAALIAARIRSYSSLPAWLTRATTVAQHVEVNYSCLALLAVSAVIVVHRMSLLVAPMARSQGHELLRRT